MLSDSSVQQLFEHEIARLLRHRHKENVNCGKNGASI